MLINNYNKEIITTIVFSHGGKMFLTGDKNGCIKLWSLTQKEPYKIFYEHNSEVNKIEFFNDSQSFISCSNDKTIHFWRLLDYKPKFIFENKDSVKNINLSFDNKTLLSVINKDIILWDLIKGQKYKTYIQHEKSVYNVNYIDHNTAISNSLDGTIKIWDINTGQIKYISTFLNSYHFIPIVNSNKEIFILSINEPKLVLWDLFKEKILMEYDIHYPFTDFDISKNKDYISVSYKNTLDIFSISKNKSIFSFTEKEEIKNSIFHPKKQAILSTYKSGLFIYREFNE